MKKKKFKDLPFKYSLYVLVIRILICMAIFVVIYKIKIEKSITIITVISIVLGLIVMLVLTKLELVVNEIYQRRDTDNSALKKP